MRSLNLDPVLYLQMEISRLYRKRHNMSITDFVELGKQVDILGFLERGYEPFHLTGEEGILDEVDSYVDAWKSGKSQQSA
jgi:hypothetical protein